MKRLLITWVFFIPTAVVLAILCENNRVSYSLTWLIGGLVFLIEYLIVSIFINIYKGGDK